MERRHFTDALRALVRRRRNDLIAEARRSATQDGVGASGSQLGGEGESALAVLGESFATKDGKLSKQEVRSGLVKAGLLTEEQAWRTGEPVRGVRGDGHRMGEGASHGLVLTAHHIDIAFLSLLPGKAGDG